MSQLYGSHPQYPPLAPAPQNGFGTAGFVLGLIGLVFSFIPVIGVVAWPLVLLALAFSGIGLARVRAGRVSNTGQTIAGLACAAVGLLVCIGYAAAFGAAVAESSSAAPTRPWTATRVPAKPAPTMAASAPPASAASGPATTIDEGVYEVGVDITPGKYKTSGTDSYGCYYARLKTGDGSLGDIINNNITQGPATVTIKESDGYFETKGCETWTKVG
jgi:hypothetical protein